MINFKKQRHAIKHIIFKLTFRDIQVYELASSRNNHDRCERIREWHRDGGIMIVGYQLYRILVNSNTKSKKRKQIIDSCLVDPGTLVSLNLLL